MKTTKVEKWAIGALFAIVASVAYAGIIVHGQLVDASAENLSSDPTAHAGRFYWNTTNHTLKFYNDNASAWRTIVDTTTSFSNPMNTLGDIVYEDATPQPTRLAGNITTTNKFLSQTGTGSISAVPAWNALVAGDIPSLAASKITSGQLAAARGGTGGDFSGATGAIFVSSGAFSSVTIDTAWTTYTPTVSNGCSNGSPVTSARYIHTNPKLVRFEIIISCTGAGNLFSVSIPVTADYAGQTQVLVGNVSSSYAGAATGFLPIIVSGDMTHVYVSNTSATQTRLNGSAFTTTTSIVTMFFDVAI